MRNTGHDTRSQDIAQPFAFAHAQMLSCYVEYPAQSPRTRDRFHRCYLQSSASHCEAHASNTLQTRCSEGARMVGKLLSALGGQGPILLVISLCAGVFIHPLAHFGYSLLPVSAFLLTLGSFLTAGLAPSEVRIRMSVIGVVLIWV